MKIIENADCSPGSRVVIKLEENANQKAATKISSDICCQRTELTQLTKKDDSKPSPCGCTCVSPLQPYEDEFRFVSYWTLNTFNQSA